MRSNKIPTKEEVERLHQTRTEGATRKLDGTPDRTGEAARLRDHAMMSDVRKANAQDGNQPKRRSPTPDRSEIEDALKLSRRPGSNERIDSDFEHSSRERGGLQVPFLTENYRAHGQRYENEFNEGGFGGGFGNGFGFQQTSGVSLPFGLGGIGFNSGVGVGA